MSKNTKVNLGVAAITSLADVHEQLLALDKTLKGSALAGLLPFNKAYEIVTRQINESIEDDYFSSPTLIEKFSIEFAVYYFEAINAMRSGRGSVAPAWHMVRKPHKSAYIALLMGANAHINYDLPQVIAASYGGGNNMDLMIDLIRIDKLLAKSGREILVTLAEPSPRANLIKNHLWLLYFTPSLQLIRHWRVRAWRNSKYLVENSQNIRHISIHSARTARRFAWLDKQT